MSQAQPLKQTQMQPVKRRPGRPRASEKQPPGEVRGIITEHEDNIAIDFLSYRPTEFKKIFQLFRNASNERLYIIFEKDKILFSGRDYNNKNLILGVVNCDVSGLYYYGNKERIIYSIMRSSCDEIARSIENDSTSFKIRVFADNPRRVQFSIFKKPEGSEQRHAVEAEIGMDIDIENDIEIAENEYSCSCSIDAKSLKKTAVQFKSSSAKNILLMSSHSAPLNISAETISYSNTYSNSEAINYKSDLVGDDVCVISVKSIDFYAFGNMTIMGKVGMYLDDRYPLLLKSELSKENTIKMYIAQVE